MKWKLCGGTLLNRMGRVLRPTSSMEMTLFSAKTTISKTGLLISILNMVKPGFDLLLNDAFYNESSAYWNCRRYTRTAVPFNSPSVTGDYLKRVEQEYASVRDDMELLCRTFLKAENEVAMSWLAEALIELTLNDGSIPEFYKLRIMADGSAMKKCMLRDATSIDLPSLLVGLWTYVMGACPDNTEGRDLILHWAKEESDLRPTRNINVTVDGGSPIPDMPQESLPAKEKEPSMENPASTEDDPEEKKIVDGNTTIYNNGNGHVIKHVSAIIINYNN